MAPVSQIPKPTSWSVVAIVFIALFILLLFATSLVIGYLYHQKKQKKNLNPYSYGSKDWLDYERATATQAERDALAIASLESRVSVQESYNQEADKMIELLDRSQKHLTLQLRDQQRKSEPVDPEVFQRIYDDIHKPLQPPRPSLPPLAAKSSPTAQHASPPPPRVVEMSLSAKQPASIAPLASDVVKPSPPTQPTAPHPLVSQSAPMLLQTTKLRDIMRSNLRPGPARTVCVIEHKPLSAILVDSAEFEVVDLSDDEPVPPVSKKPTNYHAR